ncbi:MAG: CUB domain-containing protein, partial [Bacteroidia bacterium]|nr:CUB domain-containing protein [Bacteroidia bacterium]
MKSVLLSISLALASLFAFGQTPVEISLPIKKTISERPNYRFMGEEEYYKLKSNEGLFLASSSPTSYNNQYSVGYSSNENTGMVVEGKNKLRIRLDWFFTEEGKDVLTIYDGPSDKYPVLVTYSGNGKQGNLTVSTQNKVYFKFTSNGSQELPGFRFRIDEANLIGGKVYQPNNTLSNDPPSDDCNNAPIICNLGGYQGATDIYTADHTNITGFCGSIENNSWLAFIASTDTATIKFNSFNCNDPSSGIQALIYQTSDCNNFTVVSNCVSQGNGSGQFTITTNTPLIPGKKYYIMVDGYGGNVCQYTIAGGSGVSTALSITANPSVICPGGSVTLTATNTATSYSWISNPPAGVIGTTQSITVTPSTTTSYTVYTGPGQCATFGDSANTTVTISNTLPPPTINVPTPVCEGSTLVLSTNSGAQGASYTWTGPNGFASSQSSPSIPNATAASNNGSYSLTISYGPSCSTQTGTATVTVDQGPSLTLTPSSSTICGGGQVSLTGSGAQINPLMDANPYSYSWNSQEAGVTTESCTYFLGMESCSPSTINMSGFPTGPRATVTPNQS